MRSFVGWRAAATCFVAGLMMLEPARAEDLQDCTGGRPDASKCLEQLRSAEVELLSQNRLLRKKLASKPVPGAQSSLRRSHQTWVAYREAQCGLEHLLDGTGDAYRPAMVASCRLGMTRDRIKDVQRQLDL